MDKDVLPKLTVRHKRAYFAKGGYSEQEELVAGSPEYAFNEYLQLAVEHGIPVLLCVLLFIGFCLWRGIAQGRGRYV